MKITNIARVFAGKKWVFYVAGVVVLGIVATTIWFCNFYIPQREFNKSFKTLLREYSLIVEDINGVYTDESVSTTNFGEKSKEISKDLSDLRKTVIAVDIPNDDAREKITLFKDVLRVGIDAINKGCQANDAYLQYQVSKSALERTEDWYWSSESGFEKIIRNSFVFEAKEGVKECLDSWLTLGEALKKKIEEYRESHNGLLEKAKQVGVNIPELQFVVVLGE